MAAYISFQPSDFFNTTLYTGNGTAIGSGGLAVTGVGFQPDFTWIKNRDTTDNYILTDAVRGATNYVNCDRTNIQATNAESLTTWGADGFTLGNHAAVNTSAEAYVSWNWKAGTTTGLSGGTITPTAYSINTTSGFGIYQYDGNSTSGATIAHGLGAVPQLVIVKCLDAAENWATGQVGFAFTQWMPLDTSGTPTTTAVTWNDTAPTSTLITLGDNALVNTHTTLGYIMYAFAEKRGFSKFGVYTGNNNVEGPMIYTGFRPAWVLFKRIDSSENWSLYDNKRGPRNVISLGLRPNLDLAESSYGGANAVDFLSNGFKIREGGTNINNGTYIYSAFAEYPLVSSNSKSGVAR
tara:strand:+ start:764 stop:1816 length:1053 start_codon:yes stop_codon:yes gene_type:complete